MNDEKLRFGVLFTTQLPSVPGSMVSLWNEILEACALADETGFYSVHLPEHHMREDGYLPQPMVAAAAIAQRTKHVKIGPTVMLAPLRHPVHLAEEAAMVDVLSNGRLILGLGIGNFQPEFELFDLSMDDQAARFDEVVTVLLRVWEGAPLHFEGRFFTFAGEIVRPLPVQRPRPPVWIGGMSNPGVRRAARFGLPLVLDPLHPIADLKKWTDLYRSECDRLGQDGEVVLIRYGWLGDRDDLATNWWPHIRETFWTYLKHYPRLRADIDPRIAACNEIDELEYEWIEPDRLLAGTADEVRSKSEAWAEQLGASHVIVKLQGATGPWGDDLTGVIRDWGTQVAGACRGSQRSTLNAGQ